jgi:transcriptional regulator with XRE-family HTH domain
MKPGASAAFGTQLKALREAAGFTQEELATIAGLSVHAVSALERGERRPHVETVRALSVALGWVALATGDVGQAERLLDEAVSVLRHAGPWFLELTLYLRAILAVRRANPDGAIALVRESLMQIRELDDKFAFVYALVPLAAAAVLKGNDAWAARILGARDAVTERTGATVVDKSVHDLKEQAEQGVRERLGPDRWTRAYAAGRKTSIDALVKEIDSVG